MNARPSTSATAPIPLPTASRQGAISGAPGGRQQADGTQANCYNPHQGAGSGGRGQFDLAFPSLGPMLAPMEPTSLLPPAKTWNILESTAWLTSTPYHGLRRLSKASRDNDTAAVYQFLCKQGILEANERGNRVVHKGRSGNNLFRRNIQKEFYWIWKIQVEKLGEFLSRESRKPTSTGITESEATREIDTCLHK